jgi:hypothetical protein
MAEEALRVEKANEDPEIRKDYLVSVFKRFLLTNALTRMKALVRRLFKDMLKINQDSEIVLHEIIPPTLAIKYAEGQERGPDLNGLHLDMKGGLNSDWNVKTISLLAEDLELHRKAFDLPERLETYREELVREKLKRLRVSWREFQPKTDEMGAEETPEALEACILEKHTVSSKQARQPTW